jgi:hypothetical protein
MFHAKPIKPHCFVAEAPLEGVQVTIDGFVQNGTSTVMGITDSIMYPGTMSFARFEYPSSLPDSVQARMIATTNRLMEGSQFDHSCYNVEFFYDERVDRISVIEINPRMSYQFSDLFDQVDGRSGFSVQLAIATGQNVDWQPRQGPCKAAASYVMRRFRDATVLSTPNAKQLADVESRFSGTHVELLCQQGDRLSDYDQDVESFRYCIVNMAAPSKAQLASDFADVTALLPFKFLETNSTAQSPSSRNARPIKPRFPNVS